MDARMRRQRSACFFAFAGDDIERAVRQSCVLRDAREGSAVRLASSAGFSTVALPAASAPMTERPMICIG